MVHALMMVAVSVGIITKSVLVIVTVKQRKKILVNVLTLWLKKLKHQLRRLQLKKVSKNKYNNFYLENLFLKFIVSFMIASIYKF